MARTCPACGHANDDRARYCQSCGTPLAGEHAPASSPGTPPAGPRRPGGIPTWSVVVVVLAAIALAGAIAFAFLPRGEEEGTDGEEAGASVVISPTPALGQYLAGAVGPRADRLAAIAADGSVELIARFRGEEIRQIAYSPDSARLACVAGTFKRSDLWLFDTATGAALQVTADAPDIVAVDGIAWLSPGELLVAAYTETPKGTGQNADFLVYDRATAAFRPLLDSDGVPLRGVSVSASRDGAAVAFVTYTDVTSDGDGMVTAKEHLAVLERGSGAVTELGTNKALFDVNARAFDEPLISPDGQAIIYRRAGSDVGTSYTVVGTDGATLMPAKEALMPAGYAWHPDGMQVVFTGQSPKSASGDGPVIFWRFDIEAGGGPTVLARYDDTSVQDLSWSPDGTTIAWAEYDRDKGWRTGNVYLMAAEGGDSRTLVKEALSPVWAPGTEEPLQTAPSAER